MRTYMHTCIHAAFFYDLDGTLTGVPLPENFTRGGVIKGSSFVPRSHLVPIDGSCVPSNFSMQGVGGVACVGHIFKRFWHHVRSPAAWIGKALCVRPPWMAEINTCQVIFVYVYMCVCVCMCACMYLYIIYIHEWVWRYPTISCRHNTCKHPKFRCRHHAVYTYMHTLISACIVYLHDLRVSCERLPYLHKVWAGNMFT